MFYNFCYTGISCSSSKRRRGIPSENCFGNGESLDFTKNLLQEKNAPPPPPPPSPGDTSPEWCKCNVCRPMPNEIKNVCCKRVTCITRFQAFNDICLDRDILGVCIKARSDIRADNFNFSMECFRKAAYRQFVLWRFGKLGRWSIHGIQEQLSSL